MMSDRGTPQVLFGSLQVYGRPDSGLIATAESVLSAIPAAGPGGAGGGFVDATAFAAEAQAEFDEREAKVVTLRFFGGLTVDQVAEVLGVSKRTVENDWRHAQAWLRLRLSRRDST